MASKRSALDQNASSAKKKPKRLCSFSSSWISEEFDVEYDGQTKSYSGSLLSGKDGDERAFCKQCKVSFSVSHGGAYDVRRHFKSAGHNNALDSAKKTARLEAFGFGDSRKAKAAREKQEEQKMQIPSAEAQFVQFVAEHNLPFRCGDHLTKLVKSMFPDSDIARQFQCSRTKTKVSHFGKVSRLDSLSLSKVRSHIFLYNNHLKTLLKFLLFLDKGGQLHPAPPGYAPARHNLTEKCSNIWIEDIFACIG